MIRTALFIREDRCLYDSIYYLLEKTSLKYVIVADIKKIDKDTLSFLNRKKVKILNHEDFVDKIKETSLENLDYIFSYYYQKRLESYILDFPKNGCINFHPAPLPKYRGVGNYSRCILDELNYWGASAHYMDENFDNGDLIEVSTFSLNSKKHTYMSLEKETHICMLNLFKLVVEKALDKSLKAKSIKIDDKEISYLSKRKINEMKLISHEDNLEDIEKKIRAFWCPPFQGATITIKGKQFTLVDDKILNEIAQLYKGGDCK